jgi:ATP-dependent DNA ligase
MVAPAADGTTDFSGLQNELKGRSTKIVMVAFDLIYIDGRDLRSLPLFERKALLKKIVADTDIQFSESLEVVRTRRQQVGRHLRGPPQGPGPDLCGQGRPWLR